jgi:hypothetical protein
LPTPPAPVGGYYAKLLSEFDRALTNDGDEDLTRHRHGVNVSIDFIRKVSSS